MSGVPTSGTTIQRADLAQLMWEYNMEAAQNNFVGARLLPFFPVPEQSADYPFLPFEAYMKVVDDLRAADVLITRTIGNGKQKPIPQKIVEYQSGLTTLCAGCIQDFLTSLKLRQKSQ